MTNWVENKIEVFFDELSDAMEFAAIARIAKESNYEKDSLLMKFLPRKLYSESNRQLWNKRHWGTIRQEKVTEVERNDYNVTVRFVTVDGVTQNLVDAIEETYVCEPLHMYSSAVKDIVGVITKYDSTQASMSQICKESGVYTTEIDQIYGETIAARNSYLIDETDGHHMEQQHLGT